MVEEEEEAAAVEEVEVEADPATSAERRDTFHATAQTMLIDLADFWHWLDI